MGSIRQQALRETELRIARTETDELESATESKLNGNEFYVQIEAYFVVRRGRTTRSTELSIIHQELTKVKLRTVMIQEIYLIIILNHFSNHLDLYNYFC